MTQLAPSIDEEITERISAVHTPQSLMRILSNPMQSLFPLSSQSPDVWPDSVGGLSHIVVEVICGTDATA